MSEQHLAFVNEWPVFDFRLAGGLTILEDYRQRHDADFSDEKKRFILIFAPRITTARLRL
jgi:hypothetical protein